MNWMSSPPEHTTVCQLQCVLGGRYSLFQCRMEFHQAFVCFVVKGRTIPPWLTVFRRVFVITKVLTMALSRFVWWITGTLNKINRGLTFSSALDSFRYVDSNQKALLLPWLSPWVGDPSS